MALIKYRQNGKWVTLDIEATSIGSAVKIDASQIIISNINASASGNVNNGDTTTEAISKLINQIKALQNKTVDLSGYYTKTETDSKYVAKQGYVEFTQDEKNKLSGLNNYTLPKATDKALGGIKVGTGLAIANDGTLSATPQTVDLSGYYTKTETDSKYVVKVNGKGLSTNDYTTAEKTKLNSLTNYTLPAASADTLGGVKVGTGLTINSSGVLSASVNIPLFTEAEIDACFAAAKATLADADDSTY